MTTDQPAPFPWPDTEAERPESFFIYPREFNNLDLEPPSLIKGYLRETETTLLYAPKDMYKSFLALDWGLSVATSTPWMGHAIGTPGRVLFIVGEGKHGIGKRYRAWCNAKGAAWEHVNAVFTSGPVQILNPGRWREFAAQLDQEVATWGAAPALIVIDTLSTNFGGDENSAGDMSRFIALIKSELSARYECAVLLVHHTGGDVSRGARGSTALEANADTVYYLASALEDGQTPPPGVGRPVRLVCKHAKDCERAPDIELRPRRIIVGAPTDGPPISSLVLERYLG